MKYYICYANTYHNGTLVDSTSFDRLTEENFPESKEIEVTWENLNEVYNEYNEARCFSCWRFKKGRVLSFFSGNLFNKNKKDIPEWKTPLNMKLVIHYKEIKPTMIDLKHFDAVAVQKYLKEHSK